MCVWSDGGEFAPRGEILPLVRNDQTRLQSTKKSVALPGLAGDRAVLSSHRFAVAGATNLPFVPPSDEAIHMIRTKSIIGTVVGLGAFCVMMQAAPASHGNGV